MNIMKFKLLNEGNDGIVVEAKEYLASGHFKIVDDVKRTRKVMVSDELKKEVNKLKYFLLNLTGHWIAPYSKFYDNQSYSILPITDAEPSKVHLLLKYLWNIISVTGAKATKKGFLLTGTIEAVEGKKMGFSTPFITADDDIGFFSEAQTVLDNIAKEISGYLRAQAIPIDQAIKELPEELKSGKNKDEIVEAVFEYMMKRGAIIMMDNEASDTMLNENNNEDESVLHKSTRTIDAKLQQEAKNDDSEEEESDQEQSEPDPDNGGNKGLQENKPDYEQEDSNGESENITVDEKKNPYGPPAADIPADITGDVPRNKTKAEQAANIDLTLLEHSENMGVELPDEEQEEGTDEW